MQKEKYQSGTSIAEDSCTRLANQIILQAVKDYRIALRRLQKNPKSQEGTRIKEDVERFFHSSLYGSLTEVNPDMLIRKLNEEVGV